MSEHWCDPIGARGEMPCFGAQMRCGHAFDCAADPAIDRHRCAGTAINMWWSLLVGIVAFAVVFGLLTR